MAIPTPSLGYGQRDDAPIDVVNQYMRSAPWYQALLKSFGQDPNNVHLTDNQKQQVIRAAQANGIVVDEGGDGQEVDDSGNFQAKGHKLRNTLIVAGIAGATIATMGAAGVFGGAAGAGAAGAGAAGAGAGTGLASTAIGSGFIPAIAGGTGLAAGAGATTSGILGTAGLLGGLKTAKGILGAASSIGSAFGANAQGRADGRLAEANANAQYDRTAADLYRATTDANTAKNRYNLDATTGANNFGLNRGNLANDYAQTDLSQRKYALAAPGQRAGNAVRGDILSSAHDVSVSGLGPGQSAVQFSGGLHPDMFSADTRALGADMTQQARTTQAAGDHFAPLPDLPTYTKPPAYTDGPTAPTSTPMPQAGKVDSILNTAGLIGNIAGLLPSRQPKPPTAYDPNDQMWMGG